MNLPLAAARAFASLLYPPSCEQCHAPVEPPRQLCDTCAAEARRIEEPYCAGCSAPFHGAITGAFVCAECEARHGWLRCCVSKYRATGVVREFIHRFKYSSQYRLRHQLAAWAGESLDDPRIRATKVDALVPVPLFPARERQRQFNQAGVIARLLARAAGVPVSDCLLRVRDTGSQLAHGRQGRMENLRNAFRMRNSTGVRGLHLVLTDDVLTTGSTLEECARVLTAAGAASVRGITVARG